MNLRLYVSTLNLRVFNYSQQEMKRFSGKHNAMDVSTYFDITRALKVSIRGLPKDWRRPSVRPRHTWLCTLEADL